MWLGYLESEIEYASCTDYYVSWKEVEKLMQLGSFQHTDISKSCVDSFQGDLMT